MSESKNHSAILRFAQDFQNKTYNIKINKIRMKQCKSTLWQLAWNENFVVTIPPFASAKKNTSTVSGLPDSGTLCNRVR